MKIFIISWVGQHDNALYIAKHLARGIHEITIIYSDPNLTLIANEKFKLIRRSNDLFWGDKFKACLDTSNDEGILIIHADCKYSDWCHLISVCEQSLIRWPMIGVWSPKIDFVPWDLKVVEIGPLIGTNLKVVARTDGIIFYLAPKLVERMKLASYEENIYGWGVEWMFICAAYCNNLIAVIDTSVEVFHPKTEDSYPRDRAHQQLNKFMKQLTLTEEIQGRLLDAIIKKNGGFPIPSP